VPRVKTNKDVIEGRFLDNDARNMQALRDEFIEWLSVPPARRQPKSQEKMAKHLGVVPSTLTVWKRDPRIINAVKGKIRNEIAVADLPDIVDSLKEQAFNPDNARSVQAAKLLIELMKEGENDAASVPLGDMSNEELREMAAKLHDEFDERIESA